MKSGLEGRNNVTDVRPHRARRPRLNEVRPGRPEQSYSRRENRRREKRVSMKSGLEGRNNGCPQRWDLLSACVSMKSGLEGRNNASHGHGREPREASLNEVRPGRPEQSRKPRGRGRLLNPSQ